MKLLNGIFKWIVCLVLTLSMGLLVIIFLSSKPELSDFQFRLILLVSVGLVGGLAFRLLFKKMPTLIVVFLSMISNLFAVLIIDHFYEVNFQFQFISADFRIQSPNVSDGSQFLLMTMVSLLPLLLFRPVSKTSTSKQKSSTPKKANKTFAQNIDIILAKADPRNWKLWKKTESKSAKLTPAKNTKTQKPVVSVARSTSAKVSSKPVAIRKSTAIKTDAKKVFLPAKIVKGSQNEVKLVGEEEHVCPYCLEEVAKADNRGVKVCPECGTWHHQDCWSLTGSCGVAHRNEL
jgi:hypothetical protein